MLLEGKLTTVRFPSLCNVFDDNVVILDETLPYKSYHTLAFSHRAMFLGLKLTLVRFPSWCNIFDDNVVVLDEKLLSES